MNWLFKVSLLIALAALLTVDCGINKKMWKKCRCRFETWESWSDCDSECNGQRERTRKVWIATDIPSCPFEYSTCASSDMAWDYLRCNSWCYNGGTSDSYSCTCKPGYYGNCCEHEVQCGNPGTLANGRIQGSYYTYGREITYSCNNGYRLISGSTRRKCLKSYFSHSGYWSGNKPRCSYFISCKSGPCKNGATCTNIADGYKCTCANGWSGRQCSTDIQPPLVSNCPKSMDLKTTELEIYVNWTKPHFHDPHGQEVKISSNYPKNGWMFPWGDFTVSYSAVKPFNGLKTDCVFNVTIRPHTCKPLSPPLNGAIICNNWKTDFGIVCLDICHANYTVARGMFPNQWYVCVTSGSWMPSDDLPKCLVDVRNLQPYNPYNIGFTFKSCQDDLAAMQEFYIRELKKSPFKFLCQKFSNECNADNVSVICK